MDVSIRLLTVPFVELKHVVKAKNQILRFSFNRTICGIETRIPPPSPTSGEYLLTVPFVELKPWEKHGVPCPTPTFNRTICGIETRAGRLAASLL